MNIIFIIFLLAVYFTQPILFADWKKLNKRFKFIFSCIAINALVALCFGILAITDHYIAVFVIPELQVSGLLKYLPLGTYIFGRVERWLNLIMILSLILAQVLPYMIYRRHHKFYTSE